MTSRSLTANLRPHERIILPWDKPTMTMDDIGLLGRTLDNCYGMLKLGYEAMTARMIRSVIDSTVAVQTPMYVPLMMDLKLRGTRDTLKVTIQNLVKWPASIITIDANMPSETILAVFEAVGTKKAVVAGVAATSDYTPEDIGQIYGRSPDEYLLDRAAAILDAAEATGVRGGFVGAPPDLAVLNGHRRFDSLIKIAVGVRSETAGKNNHARFGTPMEAIRAGADYLVIGRPILEANLPRAAIEAYAEAIEKALR